MGDTTNTRRGCRQRRHTALYRCANCTTNCSKADPWWRLQESTTGLPGRPHLYDRQATLTKCLAGSGWPRLRGLQMLLNVKKIKATQDRKKKKKKKKKTNQNREKKKKKKKKK